MKLLENLALIISGSLFGALAQNLSAQIDALRLTIAAVTLLLIGFGLLRWILSVRDWFLLAINRQRNFAAVFCPYEVDSDTSSWTTVSVTQICQLLKPYFGRVDKVAFPRQLRHYPVVINPYGGVYPEDDLTNLSTLNEIFSFVRNGGIFINVADIPFYYAYDKNLLRRIDTTPLTGLTSIVERSFLRSLLTDKLHALVFALLSDVTHDGMKIERVIVMGSNSRNLQDKEVEVSGFGSASPFIAIPYGKGFFVFSTYQLNNSTKNHIKKIAQAVVSLQND